MFLALYLDEGWSRNKDGDAAKRSQHSVDGLEGSISSNPT